MKFKLGNLICETRKKISGFWNIDGYEIPTTIINGKNKGKTVVISSGIHNCEYTGIQTAIEISQELNPENINGVVIIFHPVNYSGFFKKIPAVIPEDNKNLNRAFPGNVDGSICEKIAYNFSKTLYSQIDFFIDLHGGDLYEEATSFVYFPGIGKKEIVDFSEKVAQVLSTNYRVRSLATTGAYNSAAIQGVPSLLIERGGNGIWDRDGVIDYKKDIFSILNYLGSLTNFEYRENPIQIKITQANYISSHLEGYWYPRFRAGEIFEKNIILGEIKDCFGKTLATYISEYKGVILYQVSSLAIRSGEEILAYGKI